MSELKNLYSEAIDATIAELIELDGKLEKLVLYNNKTQQLNDRDIIINIICAENYLFCMMLEIVVAKNTDSKKITSKQVFDIASEDRFANVVRHGSVTFRGDRFVKFAKVVEDACDDKFIEFVRRNAMIKPIRCDNIIGKSWDGIWKDLRLKYYN